tara:strand:- start:1617 stop:2252 length:636 start_codon:yes stop_codon:yes gene_type:complete
MFIRQPRGLLLIAVAVFFDTTLGEISAAPPRGWRSWIAFKHEADQTTMLEAMKSLVKQRPLGENNGLVSLQDLGYNDVGLDGGWALCEGVNRSYHDALGSLMINTTKFPSFLDMNNFAHLQGLTSSWYLNCDQCVTSEVLTESATTEAWYASDAKYAADVQFDGIKFDTQPGGPNWNITKWSLGVKMTGRPMVLEDCLGDITFSNESRYIC